MYGPCKLVLYHRSIEIEYLIVIFKRWVRDRPVWQDGEFLLDDGVKVFTLSVHIH